MVHVPLVVCKALQGGTDIEVQLPVYLHKNIFTAMFFT